MNRVKNTSDLNFISIDVETAQGPRWSICQIGLVIVEHGIIQETISYLIQPPDNKYSQLNINIHGITPDITKNEPNFKEVWNKIKPIITSKKIVAHNASFDIDCINKTLQFYNIEAPNFNYDCTYVLTGERLDVLCEAYDIELINQHNAVSDAIACAKIYINLHEGKKPDYSIIRQKKQKAKNIFSFKGHERLQGDVLKPDIKNANPSSPFYNKKVVFTGVLSKIPRKEAAQIVKKMGADIDTGITKKTNIVIIGKDPGPSKMDKIVKYKNEGFKIKVVSEEDFLKMIM